MNEDARWFDERPRRAEVCPRCRGCGEVDLPYALRQGGPVTGSPNEAIRAWVCGSFDIFEACREAAEIAGPASRWPSSSTSSAWSCGRGTIPT